MVYYLHLDAGLSSFLPAFRKPSRVSTVVVGGNSDSPRGYFRLLSATVKATNGKTAGPTRPSLMDWKEELLLL
jgi:hypothetical protein